jgi:hypothetical protein
MVSDALMQSRTIRVTQHLDHFIGDGQSGPARENKALRRAGSEGNGHRPILISSLRKLYTACFPGLRFSSGLHRWPRSPQPYRAFQPQGRTHKLRQKTPARFTIMSCAANANNCSTRMASTIRSARCAESAVSRSCSDYTARRR